MKICTARTCQATGGKFISYQPQLDIEGTTKLLNTSPSSRVVQTTEMLEVPGIWNTLSGQKM